MKNKKTKIKFSENLELREQSLIIIKYVINYYINKLLFITRTFPKYFRNNSF